MGFFPGRLVQVNAVPALFSLSHNHLLPVTVRHVFRSPVPAHLLPYAAVRIMYAVRQIYLARSIFRDRS